MTYIRKATLIVVGLLSVLLIASCEQEDGPAEGAAETDGEEDQQSETNGSDQDEESGLDDDHFDGKQITFTITSSAGGGLDTLARSQAELLGKHLPGDPDIVTENRAGAGHTVGNNWFVENAETDGTNLIYTASSAIDQQIRGSETVNYDLAEYEPLGAMKFGTNAVIVRPEARDQATSKETEPAVVGDTDGIRTHVALTVMADRYLGHDYEYAIGYPGGNELEVALLQGEIDVYGTKNAEALNTLVNEEGAAEPLFVDGDSEEDRRADFPDTPTLGELLEEEGVEIPEDEQGAFDLWFASSVVDHIVSAPPGTDPEVAAALRTAYEKVVEDPDFVETATPIIGEQIVFSTGEETKDILETSTTVAPEDEETLNEIRAEYDLPVEE